MMLILKIIAGWFALSVMGAMIFSQIMEAQKRRDGRQLKR